MFLKSICKVIIIMLLITLSSCKKEEVVSIPEPTNSEWTRMANFGGQAVAGSASFTIGTKAYVVSGKAGNSMLNQVYQYNSVSNTWTAKNNFPGKNRLDFNGFTIGGKGYVCLGSDNQVMLSDIWEYDPQNDTWTKKADFPGGARLLSTTIVINQKAYIIAGSTSYPGGQKNDVWEYDPQSDHWTRKNNFPGQSRNGAAGFTIGNKGYVGTGIISDAPYNTIKDFWEYDQPTDTWTKKSDFPALGRGYAQCFTINNKGYIALGLTGINSSGTVLTLAKDVWEYDPQSNVWTQKQIFLGSGRSMATSFVIGSNVFIGLGNNENLGFLIDFWKFTP